MIVRLFLWAHKCATSGPNSLTLSRTWADGNNSMTLAITRSFLCSSRICFQDNSLVPVQVTFRSFRDFSSPPTATGFRFNTGLSGWSISTPPALTLSFGFVRGPPVFCCLFVLPANSLFQLKSGLRYPRPFRSDRDNPTPDMSPQIPSLRPLTSGRHELRREHLESNPSRPG